MFLRKLHLLSVCFAPDGINLGGSSTPAPAGGDAAAGTNPPGSGGMGGTGGAAPASSGGSSAPPAAPAAVPAAPPTPAPGLPPGSGTPAAGQTPPANVGWREVFQQSGIDPSRFKSEAEAAQWVRQAQQLHAYQPLVREVQGDWSNYQKWKAEQARAQQQAAPQKEQAWWAKYWNPPEHSPAWEKQIVRDPVTNQLVPAEGAPPDVVNKYLNYQSYRQQQAEKLMANPYEFFEGAINDRAEQVAKRVMADNMKSYQDNVFAQEFTQQNASWLYQRDAQGNLLTQPVMDPQTGYATQQKVLSPHGQLFAQHIQAAQRLGINDVTAQKEYALNQLNLAWAMAQLQQHQGAQQGQQQKTNFQQNAAANAPGFVGGTPPAPGTPPNALNDQDNSLSLGDRIRNRFKEAGITDAQIASTT